jgi:hypothetical protein
MTLSLLVVCGATENWYELLRGVADVAVEQATWDELSVCSYSDSGVVVRLGPAKTPVDERQRATRGMPQPHLVLVRNFARSVAGRLGRKPDFRNALYALAHAGVPCMNSFAALLAELERPVMYGALLAIQRRLGSERFPLVPQYYYPDHFEMTIVPPYPIVVKVGFPHAGYGKIRVANSDDWEDLAGITAIHNTYATAEPLLDVEYELRIVRVGPAHYRAHKRIGAGWKVNTGASMREDVPMEPRWKLWVDETSKIFGGLDILALDVVVDKAGHVRKNLSPPRLGTLHTHARSHARPCTGVDPRGQWQRDGVGAGA